MDLVYIGDRFYSESGTLMSSLYTEAGQRSDWGFVQACLRSGGTVSIRQATDQELAHYEAKLMEIKGQMLENF